MNLRPTITCNPEGIPLELRQYPQFVVWKLLPPKEPDGKPRKVPYNPRTGKSARVNDSATWGTFPEAVAAFQTGQFCGIGFVFASDDPYIGIDLDNAIEDGRPMLWAAEIIQQIGSYVELSVSGTGVHLLCRGDVPPIGRRKAGIEIYNSLRFFVLTGVPLPDTPQIIEERTEALRALFMQEFGEPEPEAVALSIPAKAGADMSGIPDISAPGSLSDTDVLATAFSANNGERITALYAGNTSAYRTPSEADLGLAQFLAFYTHDAEQLERLLRNSNLYRDKWDEARGASTYIRAEVVEPALRDCKGKHWKLFPQAVPQEADAATAVTSSAGCLSLSYSLYLLMGEIETKLRKQGAQTTANSLLLPPDLDRENVERIGRLLKRLDTRMKTLLNFLWADWYSALPRGKGVRRKIVLDLFGGTDSVIARKEMQRLSELARIASRIPLDLRKMDCPWSLYEAVARFENEERRRHWLEQKPYKGMTQDIEAEWQESRRPPAGKEAPSTAPPEETGTLVFTVSEEPDIAPVGDVLPSILLPTHCVGVGREQNLVTVNVTEGVSTSQDVLTFTGAEKQKIEAAVAMLGWTLERFIEQLPAIVAHYRGEPQRGFAEDGDIVTLTDADITLADAIAEARSRGHDHCRKTEEDAGSSEGNRQFDRVGARGELAYVRLVERRGMTAADWNPLASSAIARPDLYLGGCVPIEVKTTRPGSGFVCVNEKQRQLFAAVEGLYYVPVLAIDERTFRICHPVPASEVSNWKLMTPKDKPTIHAPFRSIAVSELRPMHDLSGMGLPGEKERPAQTPVLAPASLLGTDLCSACRQQKAGPEHPVYCARCLAARMAQVQVGTPMRQ